MTITKLENGKYLFKGIDSYNNKEMTGHIIYQPNDVSVNRKWQVVFGLETNNINRAFFGSTMKECKNWLTN